MSEISISINIPTLIFFTFTLLGLGACLCFIGYLLGKNSNVGVYNISNNNVNKKNIVKKNNIAIDENKIVTDIKTDSLEKKYESLGETKESQENISESINKLKNLKR